VKQRRVILPDDGTTSAQMAERTDTPTTPARNRRWAIDPALGNRPGDCRNTGRRADRPTGRHPWRRRCRCHSGCITLVSAIARTRSRGPPAARTCKRRGNRPGQSNGLNAGNGVAPLGPARGGQPSTVRRQCRPPIGPRWSGTSAPIGQQQPTAFSQSPPNRRTSNLRAATFGNGRRPPSGRSHPASRPARSATPRRALSVPWSIIRRGR
jgi:hypothetical protein